MIFSPRGQNDDLRNQYSRLCWTQGLVFRRGHLPQCGSKLSYSDCRHNPGYFPFRKLPRLKFPCFLLNAHLKMLAPDYTQTHSSLGQVARS